MDKLVVSIREGNFFRDGAHLSPMWLKKVAIPWSAPPSYIRSSESPFGIRSVAGPWHTPSLYVLSSVAPDSAKYTAGPCTKPSLKRLFVEPVSYKEYT